MQDNQHNQPSGQQEPEKKSPPRWLVVLGILAGSGGLLTTLIGNAEFWKLFTPKEPIITDPSPVTCQVSVGWSDVTPSHISTNDSDVIVKLEVINPQGNNLIYTWSATYGKFLNRQTYTPEAKYIPPSSATFSSDILADERIKVKVSSQDCKFDEKLQPKPRSLVIIKAAQQSNQQADTPSIETTSGQSTNPDSVVRNPEGSLRPPKQNRPSLSLTDETTASDFVKSYYWLIYQSNSDELKLDQAFAKLTSRFKGNIGDPRERKVCAKASDIANCVYKNHWKRCDAEVSDNDIISVKEDKNSALVDVKFQLVCDQGRIKEFCNQRIELIRNELDRKWMIDYSNGACKQGQEDALLNGKGLA